MPPQTRTDGAAGSPVRVYLGGLGSATTVDFAEVVGHPGLDGQNHRGPEGASCECGH
jgi:hypothetical protein